MEVEGEVEGEEEGVAGEGVVKDLLKDRRGKPNFGQESEQPPQNRTGFILKDDINFIKRIVHFLINES